MKELEEELRKDEINLNIAKLQKATSRVNEKIRKENLSSKEVLFKRNQFTQEELDISDKDIKEKKMNDRIVNNKYSARSKANVKSPAPQAVTTKGQLVFLRNEMSKHSPREVYLVTNVDAESNFLIIQKLLHVLYNTSAKVTSNKFKVKQTDIIVAPNQSFYIDTPDSVIDVNHYDEAPDEAIHADDNDPEEDIWSPVVSYNTVDPHTTAPSPPALRPNPNPLPPAVPQPMLPQPLDPTQTTQPARILSPLSNDVLTGPGLFQHFPTSPILTPAPCPSPHSLLSQSSTTHLSVSTHSCDSAWDNYASSPSFNNPSFPTPRIRRTSTPFPGPALCSPSPTPSPPPTSPALDNRRLHPRGKAVPSPSASQDSSEPALPYSDDNIFFDKDDPDWQPHPQLKAPKRSKN